MTRETCRASSFVSPTAISEARYRNLAFPHASWWEWKHAKDRLRKQGKRDLSEETIFSSIAQQLRIEDIAAVESASARRSILKATQGAL